jgi:SAM-dependent methyltransferase
MVIVKRRDGLSYQSAMELCPRAREFELRHPIELAALCDGEVLVDFPSAGGYLRPYVAEIAPGSVYHAVEHVPEYGAHDASIEGGAWDHLPFEDGAVDVVITLAAIHHVMTDRHIFYDECRRVLGEKGRLIIADVESGSGPDRFLSEFVNRFSSQGHEASFLTRETEEPRLNQSGFRVAEYEIRDFPWHYSDKETALAFCRGLFRLDLATDAEIWRGLHDYLGITETPSGISMNWKLTFVRAEPQ